MHVFVSYTHQKNEFDAVSLFHDHYLNELSQLDPRATVFMDTVRIRTGDRFAEVIKKNLEQADVLLVLLSNDWLESEWCQKEFEIFSAYKAAEGRRPHILP